MIERVASWLRSARRIVVLTGAGMSAESGVPVFRGPSGLWRQFRPEDLATPHAFARQPDVVWEWYLWRRAKIAAATPHAGHDMLARLQTSRPGVTLLTQSVDGLHQRAGSQNPVELHGNIWRVRCGGTCGYERDDTAVRGSRVHVRCGCGAWLRPDVVWFGEPLNPTLLARAAKAVIAADLLLVFGTSAVVYRVAALPDLVQSAGGRLVEINTEETPLSDRADAVLRGSASEVLPALEHAS